MNPGMSTIGRPPCALAAVAVDCEAVAGLDSARPPGFDSGAVATIRAAAEDMGAGLVTVPAGDGWRVFARAGDCLASVLAPELGAVREAVDVARRLAAEGAWRNPRE